MIQVVSVEFKEPKTTENGAAIEVSREIWVNLIGLTYADIEKRDIIPEFVIMADKRIPQIGEKLDVYPTDSITAAGLGKLRLRVTQRIIEPRAENDLTHWKITVIYSNPNSGISSVTSGGRKSRLIDFEDGITPRDEHVKQAYYSILLGDRADDKFNVPTKPIETSAKRPLSEGLIRQKGEYWMRLKLEYDYEEFRSEWMDQYFFTPNLGPITVLNKTFAPLTGILQIENRKLLPLGRNARVWQVTIFIKNDPLTWVQRPLDQDFSHLDDNGKPVDILKGDINTRLKTGTDDEKKMAKEKINDPVKLDGSGSILTDGRPAVYLKFLVNGPLNWEPLDLPATF